MESKPQNGRRWWLFKLLLLLLFLLLLLAWWLFREVVEEAEMCVFIAEADALLVKFAWNWLGCCCKPPVALKWWAEMVVADVAVIVEESEDLQ